MAGAKSVARSIGTAALLGLQNAAEAIALAARLRPRAASKRVAPGLARAQSLGTKVDWISYQPKATQATAKVATAPRISEQRSVAKAPKGQPKNQRMDCDKEFEDIKNWFLQAQAAKVQAEMDICRPQQGNEELKEAISADIDRNTVEYRQQCERNADEIEKLLGAMSFDDPLPPTQRVKENAAALTTVAAPSGDIDDILNAFNKRGIPFEEEPAKTPVARPNKPLPPTPESKGRDEPLPETPVYVEAGRYKTKEGGKPLQPWQIRHNERVEEEIRDRQDKFEANKELTKSFLSDYRDAIKNAAKQKQPPPKPFKSIAESWGPATSAGSVVSAPVKKNWWSRS